MDRTDAPVSSVAVTPPDLSSQAVHRPPAWVRTADVISVVLFLTALSIALFGGFRVRVLDVVITSHSWFRVALLALVVTGVRHVIHRRPSIAVRVASGVRRLTTAESTRAIAPAFVGSRAGILLTGYLAVITFGYPMEIRTRVSPNEFANLPARWDAGWYLGIAQRGYQYDPDGKGQQSVAFFPAFPLATRAVGVLLGANADESARTSTLTRLLWAGVLVNLGALAAALGYLYRMVRDAGDRDRAIAAVQIALAYPLAFVYNAPYTEGLFLLASVGAFYHFGRGHSAAASAWGVLVGLTRSNGFLVCVPLLAIALARAMPFPRVIPIVDRLNSAPVRPRRAAIDLPTALTPVAGMLAFSAFVYLTWGDPFLWAKVQAAWGRTYQGLEPALGPVNTVIEHGLYGYTTRSGFELLHVIFFLFTVLLSIPIAFRLGLAYTALILVILLPPLVAGGWLSMARLTLVLFPIYVYLGLALPARHRVPLMVVFAMLQGFGAALFFTWRPFY